jgi:hypothetical protein
LWVSVINVPNETLKADDLQENKTIQNLIYKLLQADSNRDLKKISTFYTPLINYNGEVASKEDFLSETKAFYNSWPNAKWQILDDPIVRTDSNNISTVKYRAAFRLENKRKGIYSEGILTSNLIIITTTTGKRLIQTVSNELQNSKKGRISQTEKTTESIQAARTPARNPDSVNDQIDRLRSIRDPNERARANAQYISGMMNSFFGNVEQAVQRNPNTFQGMSVDEMMMNGLYKDAREKGLTPSEAKIEAQRQYQGIKSLMNY